MEKSDFSKYEDVDWTIDSYPELIATAFRLFENPDHDKWRSDDKDEQNDLVKIVYSKALHFMLLGGHDTLTKDEYSDISMHISEIELFDPGCLAGKFRRQLKLSVNFDPVGN